MKGFAIRTRASVLICTVAYVLSCGHAVSGMGLSPLSVQTFSRGINLSGAELNPDRIPGIVGKDYIYPPVQELDYYQRNGFDVVRLPFLWERLQPSLFGKLDEAELSRLKSFVAAAGARNMRIILSPHNFGRYRLSGKETLIGTTGVPVKAFVDFWYKVAVEFAGDNAIYGFSLMNEPHDSRGLWKRTAQAGLDAIRRADRRRLVLVPGDQWSDASRWQRYNGDLILDDPDDRIMYEAHQYFDLDHTGTYKLGYTLDGASPDRGVDWVRPFVEWLKQRNLRGIITEFGVPNNDPRWLELVGRLLSYLAQENIPWVYWAGGPWWGNYPLSAEPKNGKDSPVIAVLTRDYRNLRK